MSDQSSAAAALISLISLVFSLGFAAFMIATMWKLFAKAGKPGWAAIVPLYNAVVLLQITGRPLWFLILAFVPFLNIAFAVILCIDLARVFGKSVLFGVGIMFLSIIFLPILAFGDARYLGPIAASPAPVASRA